MNEVTNKLIQVINALNNIDVKGKSNLMNLGGCIAILEEVRRELPKLNKAGEESADASATGDE